MVQSKGTVQSKRVGEDAIHVNVVQKDLFLESNIAMSNPQRPKICSSHHACKHSTFPPSLFTT
jgi:hypothetical protein